MKPGYALPFVLLTLSACATMDESTCRNTNWYDIAYRDAIMGVQQQDDLYARQCAPFGVQPDRARYKEGWTHGHWEHEQRVGMSID